MSLSVFIAAGMSVSFFLSYHVGNSASMSLVEFSIKGQYRLSQITPCTPLMMKFVTLMKNM